MQLYKIERQRIDILNDIADMIKEKEENNHFQHKNLSRNYTIKGAKYNHSVDIKVSSSSGVADAILELDCIPTDAPINIINAIIEKCRKFDVVKCEDELDLLKKIIKDELLRYRED
jgi:transcription elongation factor